MPRIILTVTRKELEALVELALAEVRNPRDQARYILRQNLIEHRLLHDEIATSRSEETYQEKLHTGV